MGLGLFVLSNLVLQTAEAVFPEIPIFLEWENWIPIENAVALTFTVFLAGISPIIFNHFYSENKAARNVAKQKGNHFEQLIDQCINKELLVELSLYNGKCYIGYVLESQLTWPSEFDIPLVPIASGYRNKDTLELEITTHYSSIIQEFKEKNRDEFRVIIPMSQIVSARQFDQEVYARFQDMKLSEIETVQ